MKTMLRLWFCLGLVFVAACDSRAPLAQSSLSLKKRTDQQAVFEVQLRKGDKVVAMFGDNGTRTSHQANDDKTGQMVVESGPAGLKIGGDFIGHHNTGATDIHILPKIAAESGKYKVATFTHQLGVKDVPVYLYLETK